MKVIAVIVTYNRLELLKQCLCAVNVQTRKPDGIIVINNGSTDDTPNWIKTQQVTCYTQENMGGAAGFSFGIRAAYNHKADWIWVMDDDTIPEPDALEKLLTVLDDIGTQQDHIGFLASKALWLDGTINEMNRTYVLNDSDKVAGLGWKGHDRCPFIQFGTFVSMLISAQAVIKVGLPIKEYFIWNDDVEYSKRIVNAGLAGLAVSDSIVIHKTPINQMSSVFRDTAANLWKYKYGMRNELVTKRMQHGSLQFWVTWVHRMFIMPIRIALNRKDHRWAFTKVIWQTSIAAVFFRPVIEWIDEP